MSLFGAPAVSVQRECETMKIYTTYFARVKDLVDGIVPISIAFKAPPGFDGPIYRSVAPPWWMIQELKDTGDKGAYETKYTRQILGKLDFDEVIEELSFLAQGNDIALVCWERPSEFCHRNILAAWMEEHGQHVEEYQVPTESKSKKKDHADNNNKMYINDDGERVLRVTEVIRVLAKEQLIIWANMLGFKGIDYKKELERTANIGSLFHAIAEQYMDPKRLAIIDYEEFGVWGFRSRLEATNAIKSFFKWYDSLKTKYKVVFTEKVVIGKHLGGTIDCGIQGFKDPKKVIFVDYKTSPNFYMTQFLQLSGYVKIYEEKYGKDTVEGVMVILADKKKGEKARAMLIERDKLDMFITCFDCLYNTAIATRLLDTIWYDLGEEVE